MISLNLSQCSGFAHHRSGWSYCINALRPFHSKAGIILDDFMERSFSWKLNEYYCGNNPHNIPYKKDWIGFLHNPPNVPDWFDIYNSPQAILDRDVFKESLSTCKCIVVLSDYLKRWLCTRVNVPIISVKHPTYIPPLKWSPSKFLSSHPKQIVQIGYWLRNLTSIFDLRSPSQFYKAWLPSNKNQAMWIYKKYKEIISQPHDHLFKDNSVKVSKKLSDKKYDELMSSAIIFLDLHDSSANNAVIECIARNTPILINKIDAVTEYLGSDYPLYFENLDHAAHLLSNTNNMIKAHTYLKDMNKQWLSGTYFAMSLQKKLSEALI